MQARPSLIRAAVAAVVFLTTGQTPSGPNQDRVQRQPTNQNITKHDVVVEGVREAGAKAVARARSAVPSALGYRKVAERSEFFARCVKKPELQSLRQIVDGEINSPTEQAALDRLVRGNLGCYLGYPLPTPPPPFFGDCNQTLAEEVSFSTSNGRPSSPGAGYLTTCRAFYDRGALLLTAINRFVPDAELTTQQTSDAAVSARFDAMEVHRNRLRLPEDFRYFTVAVCLVRVQPVLAGRLVHAEGNLRRQDVIGRLMLLRGRTCVGNARKVHVEPNQFRIYIADAFYRWVAAARGVSSLLPADHAS